ncbi:MAG: NUDIX hydrolase [Gammaproteobacteria bacterium]|nr:NUDIX hydrolase [Gammaproteobacteria bacterium]
MNYCSACGGRVRLRVPQGDNRERFVCDDCGMVHYVNPKVVTGTLPVQNGAVLLCRRAIEPRKGRWTLPAGFLELGETAPAGAARETLEEANAEVAIDGLYTIFNLPHISQIYLFFRARLLGSFAAGEETLEARLFEQGEVPWDELAFPVVAQTLRHYFRDREEGRYPVRMEDIVVHRPRPS